MTDYNVTLTYELPHTKPYEEIDADPDADILVDRPSFRGTINIDGKERAFMFSQRTRVQGDTGGIRYFEHLPVVNIRGINGWRKRKDADAIRAAVIEAVANRVEGQ
jgi:hypothetical protein